VYLNYKRKSTVGWSIENIVLDFMGGSLSLVQIAIDSIARGQPLFGGDAFNVVKFMLSIFSIVFDTIFFIQHYFCYPDKWKNDKARRKREVSAKQLEEDLKLLLNHSEPSKN
jgi:cystinosin